MLLLPALGMSQTADSVKVLWIGNSYTYYNDMPAIVRGLALSQGFPLQPTKITKGGERFSGHLKNPKLHEALKQGGWDYIVLQEQSTEPAQLTSEVITNVYPYAHELDSLALAGSPQAKVIFYMTWGHRNGNARKDTPYPLDNTYELMQERLKTSYIEMAWMNHAWCAPVGMAWQMMRHRHPGWNLYRKDNFHPNRLGSYLAANVFLTTILQHEYTSKYTAGLPRKQAREAQRIAQKAVLDNLQLLGIKRSGPYTVDDSSRLRVDVRDL